MRSNPTALRAAREQNGHTGRSLSRASGVSQQRISDLEAGAVAVLPPTAKKLAVALGVKIADITTSDEPVEATA